MNGFADDQHTIDAKMHANPLFKVKVIIPVLEKEHNLVHQSFIFVLHLTYKLTTKIGPVMEFFQDR